MQHLLKILVLQQIVLAAETHLAWGADLEITVLSESRAVSNPVHMHRQTVSKTDYS
jgi:hypothetical protein